MSTMKDASWLGVMKVPWARSVATRAASSPDCAPVADTSARNVSGSRSR